MPSARDSNDLSESPRNPLESAQLWMNFSKKEIKTTTSAHIRKLKPFSSQKTLVDWKAKECKPNKNKHIKSANLIRISIQKMQTRIMTIASIF